MRWPNCLRSLAYAVATSRAPWAIPTAWAAIPGRLRSNVRIAMVEAVALGADPVRRRDADAVEGELGGRAAADAHLVLEPGDAEAVGRDLDDEARQAPMALGAPGSVTAKTVMRSATEPWLMNRFEPSMT